MDSEFIFKTILDASFRVHTALGPGLLESAYEECLNYELKMSGLEVYRQKPMPLVYNGITMDTGYRVDLFVENQIIVEVKAASGLTDLHMAQIITYLKLSGATLGLMINFNVRHLKDGFKRVIQSGDQRITKT